MKTMCATYSGSIMGFFLSFRQFNFYSLTLSPEEILQVSWLH